MKEKYKIVFACGFCSNLVRCWIFIAASAAFFVPASSNAQLKNSVYSMFGVGQIMENNFGINKSLGGTGIAFQSGTMMNYLNPASYLGIPPSAYIMELGAYGVSNKSENKFTSSTSSYANVNYFSASFYFTSWWASSFGVVPFSFIDYTVKSTSQIGSELTSYEKEYKGSGGLSRLYWGNSFKIFDYLSVGFNTSYIVGPITQTETASSNDSFNGYELKNSRTAYGVYLDYGLQYSLGSIERTGNQQNWVYTLGLIYGAGTKLYTTNNLEFTYEGETGTLEDSKMSDIKIPQKFGVGLSVKKGNNFRAGVDYEWKNWANVNFSDPNFDTKNSSRYSVGVEYFPYESRDDGWLKRLFYRLGANYNSSYLVIDGTPINSMGINLGVGIPYNGMNLNFSVEYGHEGTLDKGLIKNSYWMFYFNISFCEFWSVRIDR
jgi:hypothetical protein